MHFPALSANKFFLLAKRWANGVLRVGLAFGFLLSFFLAYILWIRRMESRELQRRAWDEGA